MTGCTKRGKTLIARFDDGEELVSALRSLCAERRITGGVVSAIGAVRDAEIAVFNPKTKEYTHMLVRENCEIVSLAGFVSVLGAGQWPHLHVALARPDFTVMGGHLKKAVVSPTCEMAITVTCRLDRKKDAKSGLALLKVNNPRLKAWASPAA